MKKILFSLLISCFVVNGAADRALILDCMRESGKLLLPQLAYLILRDPSNFQISFYPQEEGQSSEEYIRSVFFHKMKSNLACNLDPKFCVPFSKKAIASMKHGDVLGISSDGKKVIIKDDKEEVVFQSLPIDHQHLLNRELDAVATAFFRQFTSGQLSASEIAGLYGIKTTPAKEFCARK